MKWGTGPGLGVFLRCNALALALLCVLPIKAFSQTRDLTAPQEADGAEEVFFIVELAVVRSGARVVSAVVERPQDGRGVELGPHEGILVELETTGGERAGTGATGLSVRPWGEGDRRRQHGGASPR